LWNSVAGTIVAEAALFVLGVFLYVRATKARDRVGNIALWALVAFLILIYIANILSPPPPSVRAVSTAALAAWLFVPWAFWIDRHRQART
jgi:hypothetical protein